MTFSPPILTFDLGPVSPHTSFPRGVTRVSREPTGPAYFTCAGHSPPGV